VIPKEAQQAMIQWLSQATPPEQQLDRHWIGRYRELTSQDSFWWLSWAGPFTEEEQQQWDRLFVPPIDEATKTQLAPFVKQSRERELEAALAEQREPRLHYPAIEIDEIRHRIVGLEQLDAEIKREEAHTIVRRLYHGNIQEDIDYLRLIEATYENDAERFWTLNRRIFHEPTPDELAHAFAWVRRMLQQGFEQPETVKSSQELLNFIQEQLQLSLDLSIGKDEPLVAHELSPAMPQTISVHAVRHFYEEVLRQSGYEGWQVCIDTSGSGTRVESALRQVLLGETFWTLGNIRHLLSHELAGHVARSFAGEHSPIGLLGIGTQGYEPTEEGFALYHERLATTLHGETFDVSGQVCGMLATGLASGIVTPPQTFSSLYRFFYLLIFLQRRLLRPWNDEESEQKRTHTFALRRCLRTFRGVPNFKQAGICYLQDVIYLRGTLLLDRIVAKNEDILDRLAIGKIAYDLLPVLQELELVPPPQPLRQLAFDPELDKYILSFEVQSEESTTISP